MSDTSPTPDPDGAIYPDGVSSSDAEQPQPPVTGESGTPLINEKPEYHEPGTCDGDKCYVQGDDVPRGAPGIPGPQPSSAAPPDYSRVTNQVDGEMLIANLLVEIANLTRRALVAETMVQMYQQAAQPKPAQ